MSHGFVCIHCGWYGSDHDGAGGLSDEMWEQVKPGYTSSPMNCPGYTSEDPDSEFKLSQKDPLGRIGR